MLGDRSVCLTAWVRDFQDAADQQLISSKVFFGERSCYSQVRCGTREIWERLMVWRKRLRYGFYLPVFVLCIWTGLYRCLHMC